MDTSFWVALRNARDGRHAEAVELLRSNPGETLITSTQVRGETWTFLRRRAGHQAAVAFLDSLRQSPRLTIVFVTEAQEKAALRWLRRHDEREYSFVDATSFVVMKQMKIFEAFAFDGDFAAAGFAELRV